MSARICLTAGCTEAAGTPWTDLWCAKHDEQRRACIRASMTAMLEERKHSCDWCARGKTFTTAPRGAEETNEHE